MKKLDNKGWGLTSMIIFIIIFIFMLLLVWFLIWNWNRNNAISIDTSLVNSINLQNYELK